MLATTALASSCCLVPGARSPRRARVLAVAMAAVMAVVALRGPVLAGLAGAVVLLVLAVAVVREAHDGTDGHVAWHRAAGAMLMAVAVAGTLGHAHGAPTTAGGAVVGHPGHAVPGTGPSTSALLVPLVVAYLAWSVAAAVGRAAAGGLPGARALARTEQVSMGVSLAVMVLAMH